MTGHQLEFALESGQPLTPAMFDTFGLTSDDGASILGGFQVFGDNIAFGNFESDGSAATIHFDPTQSGPGFQDVPPSVFRNGATILLEGHSSGSLFGGHCGVLPSVNVGVPVDAARGLMEEMGIDSSGLEHAEFTAPDGTLASLFFDPAIREPAFLVSVDARPSSDADFKRRASVSICDQVPFEIGDMGIAELCADGTFRLFFYGELFNDGQPLGFGRIYAIDVRSSGLPGDAVPWGPEAGIDDVIATLDASGIAAAAGSVTEPFMEAFPVPADPS